MKLTATPPRVATRKSAAWTRLWDVTTRYADTSVSTPTTTQTQLTAWENHSPIIRPGPPCCDRAGIGSLCDLRLLGDGGKPLVLQRVHVVHQLPHLVLGVLVLGAPEESVERAHLDTDAAVHAEGEVDVKPVEGVADLDPATRLVGRDLDLVALDVDAPVGAVASAQHAHRARLLVEGDDAASPGDRRLLDVRVHDRLQVLGRPEDG